VAQLDRPHQRWHREHAREHRIADSFQHPETGAARSEQLALGRQEVDRAPARLAQLGRHRRRGRLLVGEGLEGMPRVAALRPLDAPAAEAALPIPEQERRRAHGPTTATTARSSWMMRRATRRTSSALTDWI